MSLRFPKWYADRVARLRVPLGFLLLALFLWLAKPTWLSLFLGLPASALGLLLRAWAAGHLRKNEQLVQSGPYAWVRNPLYLGTALTAGGLTTAAADWRLFALTCVVFLLVYLPAVQLEEQHLKDLFPTYWEYALRVPAFLPRRPKTPTPSRFQWSCYWRNQEYKAALAYLLVLAYLFWKLPP